VTDQPTERYEPIGDAWPERDPEAYYADDLPPPPVIIRDQTTPRMDAAQLLTRQLDAIPEDRRHRLPSGEVRAIVGQAAGTIEALEDQASQVPDLLNEIEGLRAELAEARGGDDAQALRLWRAGKMAETQAASERMWADARRHAETMVADAQDYCAALVGEAEQRVQSADPTFPQAPELPEDRIQMAVVIARYVDDVRAWIARKDAELEEHLETLGAELDEARKLRGTGTPRSGIDKEIGRGGRAGPDPDE
jgi:hypothetical protein